MKQFGFYILVILVVFAGCKKNNTPHQTIDAHVLANYNYKPGTYWIYRDSISGNEDSFYVVSNSGIQYYKSRDLIIDDLGVQIMDINISAIGKKNISSLAWRLEGNNISLYWSIINDYGLLVVIPFSMGVQAHTDTIKSIMQKFVLNGQKFDSVAVVTANGYIAPALNSNDLYYINNNIGIIKMHINHPLDTINKVWELERWKIVK
jgi:hypothetical protein